ncbi:MAG: NAD(P)H-binding protein [Pseudomonadota bacterium]
MTQKTVMLLGATGTIGRATYAHLKDAGYAVVAPVRDAQGLAPEDVRFDPAETVLGREPVDAIISCLASRTGLDAWEVDYGLNSRALKAAQAADVPRFVLLSAICVQKPRLAFQHAKLAFEAELQAAPLTWSIVRPTAFFKSLSGQVGRLRQGKPFLLFGDGELTACKPISDRDTARFLVRCLSEKDVSRRILPVGGPGPAITPRAQGEMLFAALGIDPEFRHVRVGLMRGIAGGLSVGGLVSPALRRKAELARIGHYYATESMLVWDADTGRYDAENTPEFGTDTLAGHYRALVSGTLADDRGTHAIF